jgi:hypothetical protein
VGNSAWERYKASMPTEEDTKRRAAERAAALKAKIAAAETEMAQQGADKQTADRSMFELPSVGVGTYAPSSVAQAAAAAGPGVGKAVGEKIAEKVASAEAKAPAPETSVPEEKLIPVPDELGGGGGPRVVGMTKGGFVPTTISEQTTQRQVDPELLGR